MEVKARLLENIKYVTIHHSVTGLAKNIDDLRRQAQAIEKYHKEKHIANSWPSKTGGEFGYYWIAYHYLIAQNGEYLQVQDLKYQRVHAGDDARGASSHNLHGVAICFVGNFENDIPSQESLTTAGYLISKIEDNVKKSLIVRGHKDTSLAATACPGKNLYSKIKDIINIANTKPSTSGFNPINNFQNNNTGIDNANQIEVLKSENNELKTKLSEAQNTINSLTLEKEGLIEEAAELRNTIDKNNVELMDLRSEISLQSKRYNDIIDKLNVKISELGSKKLVEDCAVKELLLEVIKRMLSK